MRKFCVDLVQQPIKLTIFLCEPTAFISLISSKKSLFCSGLGSSERFKCNYKTFKSDIAAKAYVACKSIRFFRRLATLGNKSAFSGLSLSRFPWLLMTRKIASPQGWVGSHSRYPTAFSQRVKWLAQELNIITLARAEPDCRDWDPTHQTKSYLVSYLIWIDYYIISIFEHHVCKALLSIKSRASNSTKLLYWRQAATSPFRILKCSA